MKGCASWPAAGCLLIPLGVGASAWCAVHDSGLEDEVEEEEDFLEGLFALASSD